MQAPGTSTVIICFIMIYLCFYNYRSQYLIKYDSAKQSDQIKIYGNMPKVYLFGKLCMEMHDWRKEVEGLEEPFCDICCRRFY
jgi:hypothetical protein